MNNRRWHGWYPRSWRDRYGEEYDQLLEDLDGEHRLSFRTRLDVYRAGLSLHRSCADGRRRILVVGASLLLVATGIGLGLGLSGSSNGGSYLAAVANEGFAPPRNDTLAGTNSLVTCSSSPSGASLAQSRLWRPAVPRTRETSSGTIGGITWSVLTAQPATMLVVHPIQPQMVVDPMLERVLSGAITLDDHWYSLCPPTGVTPGLANVLVNAGPTLAVVNINGRAVAYGVVPATATAQDLAVSANGASPVRPLVIASGITHYSIYVAVLPGPACSVRRVQVSDVSPEYALESLSTFAAVPCLPYQLLPIPGFGGEGNSGYGGNGPRSLGTVTSVGARALVLATTHWAPLHVSVPSGARVYFLGVGVNGYIKGSLSDLTRCDQVYVAGIISPTTATASAVFVQASFPLALLHQLPKTVDVYNAAGKMIYSVPRKSLGVPAQPVDQFRGASNRGGSPSDVGSALRSSCS